MSPKPMKYKILLAIDNQMAEEKFAEKIHEQNPDFLVVGNVVHKDSVVDFVENNPVDILLMVEGLNGDEDDFEFAINLKVKFPDLRIVFLAGNRYPGDKNLAILVTYQIFDILAGNRISLNDMIERTLNPATWQEASVYLPKSATPSGFFEDSEFVDVDGRVIKKSEEIDITNTEILSEDDIPDDSPTQIKKELGISLKDRFLKKKSENMTKPQPINEPVRDEPKTITTNVPLVSQPEVSKPQMFQQQLEELERTKRKLRETEEKAKQAQLEKERIEKEKLKIEKENQKVFKINQQIAEDYEKIQRELIELDKSRNVNSKQKVIVFYGAMPGVGNTTSALNIAIYLALKNHKVMYIEFNDILPTLSYWFDLGDIDLGLEKAFLGIETRNYQDINKCIVTKETILDLKSEMHDKHMKLPESLSYMFFSDQYIKSGENGKTNPNTLKDLLLFLLYKEGYDYVILDIYSHADFQILETATIFSSINVFTMTQDVVTIGTSLRMFSALKSNGLEFEFLRDTTSKITSNANYKNIYLINKYNENIILNKRKIKNWLEAEKLVYVPENYEDIVNGLFKALPAVLVSKNKNYLMSIKNLTDLFG
jgi:cellulose biosynthesis protein BcsQ